MCLPVKQKLRKFKPDMSLKIKEEVTKQIKAKVLKEVEYSTLLANIVPVPKKDGKVRSTVIYEPIFKMLWKDAETSWTEDCQKAFDKIKEMDPLKHIFQKPIPIGKLAKWQILLSQFDIVYVTQKEIKGQALADHLAENPVGGAYEPLKTYFPNEEVTFVGEDIIEASDGWRMFFDRAANFKRVGISAVLVSETGQHYPVSAKLKFPYTNNMVEFILVAIDYFTKWVEAASYKAVTKKIVAYFVKDRIICRFGVPESIVFYSATNLNSDLIKAMRETFKIKHKNSTAYRSQMNGAIEAANKNIKKILKKMVENHKQWHKKLPFALLGCRTTVCTSTGATPYMLVYGTEAVIPAEVEIPSLRIIQEAELSDAKWIRSRYEQLALIDGKRMNAVCHGQLYQNRMSRAFNKSVKLRQFSPGQLVLKKIFPYQ
ncbi:uncharacterized protein [Nicotiana sylvestris]|uniref:uncharacterized protein n=1 Tax=Nicotiana sylvestris TaxID=4096 RepID=UPI00388C8E97